MLDEEFITLQIRNKPSNTYVTLKRSEKVGFLCKKLGISKLYYMGVELDSENSFQHFGINSADILDTYKFSFSTEASFRQIMQSYDMRE